MCAGKVDHVELIKGVETACGESFPVVKEEAIMSRH